MTTEQQDPFADIRNKRMGELNEEQIDRATELWLRQNIGPSEQYWYSLLQSVFRVINRLRAERDAAVEDAERYRWPRDRATSCHEQQSAPRGIHYPTAWRVVTGGSDTNIDAAIDA